MTAASEKAPTPTPSAQSEALKLWVSAYRIELFIFVGAFVALAMFSGQRFLRQSEAPQFVYQAKAWLEGHLAVDREVLPNIEDWACVRQSPAGPTRCNGAPQPDDRWYSSFPAFPSMVMAPFVAIHGYQFNDTSFGVVVGALALALMYSLLRLLQEREGTGRSVADNVTLALMLGFGTLFFYCAIRGEVWFSAEVMGVALTCLYLRNAVGARRPLLAGLFWSMAVLTRTPLFFTGVFFVMEALAPEKGSRVQQLKNAGATLKTWLPKVRDFTLGALPLGLFAAITNQLRFGRFTEFGHRFFFNNRVNGDIDQWGLFHPQYLPRNLDAAFLRLPDWFQNQLVYNPWGMSLFLTLPILAFAFTSAKEEKKSVIALVAMGATLVMSAVLPSPQGSAPVGERPMLLWLVLAGTLIYFVWLALQWVNDAEAPRLAAPLLLTLLACVVPGLMYQNTGYAQFGFRFSLDYTPYVILLLAIGGWGLKKPLTLAVFAVSVLVNFWGAVAFRGFTEGNRNWP